MVPQVFRKQCPWCARSFNTYEKEKDYCTSECNSHEEYARLFPSRSLKKPESSFCLVCDLPCQKRSRFCSKACKLLSVRVPINEKRSNIDNLRKRRLIPIDVLNKAAEKKRVFDKDHAEKYVRWGGVRDRI